MYNNRKLSLNIESPCFDCEQRGILCSTNCNKYMLYRNKCDEIKEARKTHNIKRVNGLNTMNKQIQSLIKYSASDFNKILNETKENIDMISENINITTFSYEENISAYNKLKNALLNLKEINEI